MPSSLLLPLGVLIALVAWAALDLRRTGDEPFPAPPAGSASTTVAFLAQETGRDAIYLQRATPGAPPEVLAAFARPLGLGARASVSPGGDAIAVLHAGSEPGVTSLTILALDGRRLAVAGPFDYLSQLAWSADGAKLALSRSAPRDAAGRTSVEIVEVGVETGAARSVASVPAVFEAAPVGYDASGRLLVAVIDPSGSHLLRLEAAGLARVASLSVGRTREWSVSSDGARLAFLDVLGAAARSTVAKVLFLATGNVVALEGNDDHRGIAWRRGADLPDVGGPGGTLRLWGPGAETLMILPAAWSSDGERLLALVAPVRDGQAPTLEVISPGERLQLGPFPGSIPLGWVRDAN